MSKPRTGAPKRVAVGLLAGALAMFGVALAPSAGASASVTTARVGGLTRYETAKLISADPTFSAPTLAIVATGDNFPDALAASTLAGANGQAPIVLTTTSTYSPDAKAALAALKAKGVSAVTIVGGTKAIEQSVEDAIKADGFTVARVAGDDRYETAAQIATAANTKSAPAAIGTPALKTAFVTTGLNSPDALAAGPAAAANKLPILLVTTDTVPAETANAISTLGIKKVVILGGTNAVSTTVEAQLVALTGNPADRKAGINRYSTATAIADYEKATLGFPMTTAYLASGPGVAVTPPNAGFFSPDALAGGPLAGLRKAPVLLTDPTTLSTETATWLDANSSTLSSITALGGTNAVADATLAAAKTAAQNVGNDSANKAVTTRPELTGAAIVQTVTSSQVTPTSPKGTYVRYTFDETLGAFAPSNIGFKVWTAGNTATTADVATIETGTGTTGTTVMAIFGSLDTAAAAAGLSKATVTFQAVRDVGGAANPEGEAAIGTAGTTPSTPGATSVPDLKSVGNFRAGSRTGQTTVDFTFDAAAFTPATSTGFHLVDTLNVDRPCTGPANSTDPSTGTIAGGNGTTTISVTCLNVNGVLDSAAGTAYTASNVARGYVAAGTVGTTAAMTQVNPLEAADVGGVSLGPDLVSVALSTNSTGTASVGLFTFDQAISNATAGSFHMYSSTGTDLGGGTSLLINTANATQVSVTYGSLFTNAVGGNVLGDGTAVNSAVRAVDGTANQPDEEGFAGSASTLTPGRTAGPDLTGVAINAIPDAFGNVTGYGATYTFDSASTTTLVSAVASLFHLYTNDGTRYNGGTCTPGDGTALSTPKGTVKCTGFVGDLTGAAPATTTTLQAAVLGTVASGAVSDGTFSNSEGAAATSGGTGTAAS